MFKKVIVRKPSKSLLNGITSAPDLGTPDLGTPDFELALKQHAQYIETLKFCGVNVLILDSLD